jgi:hypothetical protein
MAAATSEPPLSLRARAGAVRRGLQYSRFLAERSVTPYVGWVGEGNLGDEAMFQAHRQLLPGLRFVGVPNAAPASSRALGRVPWLHCQAVCLGGGTLVGNGHFRRLLEHAAGIWPDAPRFALGVGVEDPGYRHGRRTGIEEELARWRPVLEEMTHLSVRGPLSRAALQDLGVDAEVVGDPALALRPVTPPVVERGLLGFNVGVVDDQWGEGGEAFRRDILTAARALIDAGWRLVLVSTFTPDGAFQRSLAAELGPAAEALTTPTVQDAIRALGRCEVVVAHKLHAAILAAAAGAPAVALEYRPKCRDFQASVGRGEYVMRTDELDATALVDWVATISARRAEQSAALLEAVEGYRGALARTASAVAASVAG